MLVSDQQMIIDCLIYHWLRSTAVDTTTANTCDVSLMAHGYVSLSTSCGLMERIETGGGPQWRIQKSPVGRMWSKPSREGGWGVGRGRGLGRGCVPSPEFVLQFWTSKWPVSVHCGCRWGMHPPSPLDPPLVGRLNLKYRVAHHRPRPAHRTAFMDLRMINGFLYQFFPCYLNNND